jgi:erythrocyte band 7 integral membrane protein
MLRADSYSTLDEYLHHGRYLEAMQQMAKTANSKVIFLPAQNQTVQEALAKSGEGPSNYSSPAQFSSSAEHEYGHNNQGFQSAINSSIVEHM